MFWLGWLLGTTFGLSLAVMILEIGSKNNLK